MSKIFKLKRTVSLVDAAKHLSISLNEDVSVQDIFQLALEKHIVLSICFNKPLYAVAGHKVGKDEEIVFEEKVHAIEGIFDLVMVGTERSAITEFYNNKTDCSEPIDGDYDGFYLKQNDTYYKLQSALPLDATEKNKPVIEDRLNRLLTSKGLTVDDVMDYDNHNELNDDELDQLVQLSTCFNSDFDEKSDDTDWMSLGTCEYQLLIMTSEVNRFIASLDGSGKMIEKEGSLSQKEKNTYLAFINALFLELKISPAKRGISSAIKFMTENTGTPLSENTIRKILREVVDISA